MNHKQTHVFSKGRLAGPNVGVKVEGLGNGNRNGSSPVINAAEGSTVIYAAPHSSIGHLAGLKPASFRAEGGSTGIFDMTLGEILQSEMVWATAAIVMGIYWMTRRKGD